jgi:hypothetical protein
VRRAISGGGGGRDVRLAARAAREEQEEQEEKEEEEEEEEEDIAPQSPGIFVKRGNERPAGLGSGRLLHTSRSFSRRPELKFTKSAR